MANLKEIRNRISSVSSTMQITKAMKMVSAAKLRRAQDAIVQMRPYAHKLHMILTQLSEYIDCEEDNPYSVQREEEKILLVVITSNRGLCGGFNASVTKKALQLALEDYGDQMKKSHVDFYAIGKKGGDALRRQQHHIIGTGHGLFNDLNFDTVKPVAEEIMDQFVARKYDKVMLVYNQFKNAAMQILTAEQFLPVQVEPHPGGDDFLQDYIYEPSREYILNELIPRLVKIQFYKALLDSYAAEQGARMTAMHKATDNATELLRDLRLGYNKARQATITNEILEIVSGAEALRS